LRVLNLIQIAKISESNHYPITTESNRESIQIAIESNRDLILPITAVQNNRAALISKPSNGWMGFTVLPLQNDRQKILTRNAAVSV